MVEERILASFHKKGKLKKEPTKRHKQDKLKALNSELAMWEKRLGPEKTHWLRGLIESRIKQINKRIESLK